MRKPYTVLQEKYNIIHEDDKENALAGLGELESLGAAPISPLLTAFLKKNYKVTNVEYDFIKYNTRQGYQENGYIVISLSIPGGLPGMGLTIGGPGLFTSNDGLEEPDFTNVTALDIDQTIYIELDPKLVKIPPEVKPLTSVTSKTSTGGFKFEPVGFKFEPGLYTADRSKYFYTVVVNIVPSSITEKIISTVEDTINRVVRYNVIAEDTKEDIMTGLDHISNIPPVIYGISRAGTTRGKTLEYNAEEINKTYFMDEEDKEYYANTSDLPEYEFDVFLDYIKTGKVITLVGKEFETMFCINKKTLENQANAMIQESKEDIMMGLDHISNIPPVIYGIYIEFSRVGIHRGETLGYSAEEINKAYFMDEDDREYYAEYTSDLPEYEFNVFLDYIKTGKVITLEAEEFQTMFCINKKALEDEADALTRGNTEDRLLPPRNAQDI